MYPAKVVLKVEPLTEAIVDAVAAVPEPAEPPELFHLTAKGLKAVGIVVALDISGTCNVTLVRPVVSEARNVTLTEW